MVDSSSDSLGNVDDIGSRSLEGIHGTQGKRGSALDLPSSRIERFLDQRDAETDRTGNAAQADTNGDGDHRCVRLALVK